MPLASASSTAPWYVLSRSGVFGQDVRRASGTTSLSVCLIVSGSIVEQPLDKCIRESPSKTVLIRLSKRNSEGVKFCAEIVFCTVKLPFPLVPDSDGFVEFPLGFSELRVDGFRVLDGLGEVCDSLLCGFASGVCGFCSLVLVGPVSTEGDDE